MPYYRKFGEKVGESLYRDHLNRQKRRQISEINQELDADRDAQSKHIAPKTLKLLSAKLEKDIDLIIAEDLSKSSLVSNSQFR